MKQFWAQLGAQLAAYAAAVAIVALLAYLAWRKLFGARAPGQVVQDTVDAAKSIPSGVASLVGSTIRGESAAGYITADQQRAQAAQRLALVQSHEKTDGLSQEDW